MKHNTARRQALVEQFKNELQTMIRKLRKERGLTQKQLAALLDVDQGTISNFESGKTVMNLVQAYEILLIFGRNLTVLPATSTAIELTQSKEQQQKYNPQNTSH
ncbi:helix-turn-helix transcriptional regulator [Pseudoalteromonas sp. S16_S37]|uniref:helix-turn-helix transcriptional regulator n=1 Tax=Pseudoalteromonas sp. S16_S37 TaxID=2720228 RepID=UPI0016808E6A|nr:helix-turn-helix transcriptional regulator [Pseudoalteromonas sp. S16_S37]MBD1581611.1 helix-turn-helix transcriptional regulator [Pseudoalteromonas sp. S16_S37]